MRKDILLNLASIVGAGMLLTSACSRPEQPRPASPKNAPIGSDLIAPSYIPIERLPIETRAPHFTAHLNVGHPDFVTRAQYIQKYCGAGLPSIQGREAIFSTEVSDCKATLSSRKPS